MSNTWIDSGNGTGVYCDADADNNLLQLKLKKPKGWKWELTTSKSSPNIALPRIMLFNHKGDLLVDANQQIDDAVYTAEKKPPKSPKHRDNKLHRSVTSNIARSKQDDEDTGLGSLDSARSYTQLRNADLTYNDSTRSRENPVNYRNSPKAETISRTVTASPKKVSGYKVWRNSAPEEIDFGSLQICEKTDSDQTPQWSPVPSERSMSAFEEGASTATAWRRKFSPAVSERSHSSWGPKISPVASEKSYSSWGPRISPVVSERSYSSCGPKISPVASEKSYSSWGPKISPVASEISHSSWGTMVSPIVSEQSTSQIDDASAKSPTPWRRKVSQKEKHIEPPVFNKKQLETSRFTALEPAISSDFNFYPDRLHTTRDSNKAFHSIGNLNSTAKPLAVNPIERRASSFKEVRFKVHAPSDEEELQKPKEKRRYRRSNTNGRMTSSGSILERFSAMKGRLSSPELEKFESHDVQFGPRYFLRTSRAGTIVVAEESLNKRRTRRRPPKTSSTENVLSPSGSSIQQPQQAGLLGANLGVPCSQSQSMNNFQDFTGNRQRRRTLAIRRNKSDGNILLATTSDEEDQLNQRKNSDSVKHRKIRSSWRQKLGDANNRPHAELSG